VSARVKLAWRGGVAVVALEDRAGKNGLSRDFVAELVGAFDRVAAEPDTRAVVVHGYDNYFCSGGTKGELVELWQSVRGGAAPGATSLDDLGFFDLFMRCEVPVVAAMQGHAVGGGLTLGCFADLVVMAEESVYSAVFMKYGFTPGMGATYIVPKRMGPTLGAEMLLTARNYYGRELRERGASVQIVPRAEVVRRALVIADELAEKPRLSLALLKRHLADAARAELAAAVAGERRMHERTFAQPEVRARIEASFGA
jgi:polyketide biosynthesis enoyl-CoA hydratase PksI